MAGERTFLLGFENLDKIISSLEKLPETLRVDVVMQEMNAWAEVIMPQIRRLTPLDPRPVGGGLRSSLYVKHADRGELTVTFGAGGPSASYAVIVHENLSPSVRWSTPGTGPKYIELPVFQNMPKLGKMIEERLAVELGKVFR